MNFPYDFCMIFMNIILDSQVLLFFFKNKLQKLKQNKAYMKVALIPNDIEFDVQWIKFFKNLQIFIPEIFASKKDLIIPSPSNHAYTKAKTS